MNPIRNKPTVLVVDDERPVREVLVQMLQRAGYHATEAENGLEALKILGAARFDAVLLDIEMPGMNGQQVLDRILAHDPEAAVLMVTGINDVEQSVRSMRSGACDYVLKPVEFDRLHTALDRALHLRSRRRSRAYLDAVSTLAQALEAKDPYTRGHSERVTVYALRLAQHIGLPREQLEQLEAAGPLHDIGKIGIREEVLHKPGRLDDEEFAHIQQHPVIGAHMLARDPALAPVRRIVRHHHERWDGKGYPDGLAGAAIPLGARILAVADAFDAMTSDRPYRQPMSDAEAQSRLLDCRGTQFDADLVGSFVELLDRGWIPGHNPEVEVVELAGAPAPASRGAETPAA